ARRRGASRRLAARAGGIPPGDRRPGQALGDGREGRAVFLLGSTLNPLIGVTLKPWRVELELMRLAELIANRHLDLRQTLFVEYQVLRDHVIEEEQVGRQRIDLIGRQSPLQP